MERLVKRLLTITQLDDGALKVVVDVSVVHPDLMRRIDGLAKAIKEKGTTM